MCLSFALEALTRGKTLDPQSKLFSEFFLSVAFFRLPCFRKVFLEAVKKGIDKKVNFEADYLAKLAYEGASKLYDMPLSKEVDDRIRFELHIMKTMGFPGYFLIVQDFINSARDQLGVMVGPGRGSAAGSVAGRTTVFSRVL